MPDVTRHPEADELAAFIAGRLPLERQQAVERHVAECAACAQALEAAPADTLAELLRAAGHRTIAGARGPMPRRDYAQLPVPSELQNHPRYHVLRAIGAGGMGVVYLAEHRIMERRVALKVIHPELLAGRRAAKLFRSEVRAAAKLSHPHIVRALDAEQSGELHFLVMEYLAGESLAALVGRAGPLPYAAACRYISQAALGLQHAHEQGMVHRDVKPQNLLLTDAGQVKILDFGLARLAQDDAVREATSGLQSLRLSGTLFATAADLLGTPDYMAPEQTTNAANVDIRADVYGLGGTLYFLLRGEAPYPLGTVEQKLAAHRSLPPPNLAGVRNLPPQLTGVVTRMLGKRPEDRFQTPAEVARALRPFTEEISVRYVAEPVRTPPSLPTVIARSRSTVPRDRPTAAKYRLWIAIVAVTATVAAITWRMRRDAPPTSPAPASAAATPAPSPTDPTGTHAPARAAAPVASAGPRILILLPPEFQANDYYQVRQALETLGRAHVRVASTATCRPLDKPNGAAVEPDLSLPNVRPRAVDYDALVIPGGYIQPFKDAAPARDVVWQFIDEMQAAGKPIAAVGWGQGVLAVKGTLRERKVAPSSLVQRLMPAQLGPISMEKVVVDGGIVTATDGAATECAERVLELWRDGSRKTFK